MAVYTQLGAETMAAIIERFDVGTLVSAKGIAEGVSNSNWLIETRRDGHDARFILTMYELRIEIEDLPFFLGLLDHLAARANGMGVAEWQRLAAACGADGLAAIDPGLAALVGRELPLLARQWPHDLPRSVIHADLFPDNVLMLGAQVTGLIDFYFACTDITAYDVAVTHAAWCFGGDGRAFDPALSRALLAGYEAVRPLSPAERATLPILARGAAMRFLMTRAYDWMNTPADAMVTRKDPLAFARRLEFYADAANAGVFDAC